LFLSSGSSQSDGTFHVAFASTAGAYDHAAVTNGRDSHEVIGCDAKATVINAIYAHQAKVRRHLVGVQQWMVVKNDELS